MDVRRIGEFRLGWGESVVWDEQRRRLYFVDCATHELLWLDDGAEDPVRIVAPSMPTGLAPTSDGRLVVALDDGLHVVDPDTATFELLTPYPDGLGGRANDLCADLDGNVVTGTLNLVEAPGSAWWWSATGGGAGTWRLLDPGISNTNGPQALEVDGGSALIIGDSAADYDIFDYDARDGTVAGRRTFGAVGGLGGVADGSTLDEEGGLWCALFGGAQLVRFTAAGLDRTQPLEMTNPTDVSFGGSDLDRLYVVSAGALGSDAKPLDGALLMLEGLGRGRIEPRVELASARSG